MNDSWNIFPISIFKYWSSVKIFLEWKTTVGRSSFMDSNIFFSSYFGSLQMGLIQVTSPKRSLNNIKMMGASIMQLVGSH